MLDIAKVTFVLSVYILGESKLKQFDQKEKTNYWSLGTPQFKGLALKGDCLRCIVASLQSICYVRLKPFQGILIHPIFSEFLQVDFVIYSVKGLL